MNAIESVQSDLRPKLEKLVGYLNETNEVMAASFFTNILVALVQLTEEEQLLELFIELSTTAFQGFMFDDVSWALTDDVLLYAEQVAQTFTADDNQLH
ncbi:MAG: hypothetical protein V2I41_08970 [Pseudomonadales bacterium]|jgi:hypothetical protein|nr:hypothetical protein [Pseudomonadales bacterium]